ncbi:MAG: NAD(P)-binding oxidoreductase, partial [Pseudomonadota bacterium]
MKICVFGASGRTGRAVLELAGAAGHVATAVARSPEKLADAGAPVVQASLDDADALRRAVRGQDAVISTLGTVDRKQNTVLSEGTRAIIEAMKAEDVRRFVVVTSLGCRESVKLIRSFIFRELIVKRLAKQIWADKNRQEEVIEASGLDYTIVRP